jgi:serine/threonine protein kinase
LAVDQDAAIRDAFLTQACAGDEALRREVESLLRQDRADVVLDRSVWATAAPLLDDGPDAGPGSVLGPYRIEYALGSGGMGDVFRGVDTRLNRAVAIKVLPTGIALDGQMRARFAREARAIAALAHPHICTLYDVGRHDQVDFLVMEYLEGDTLAARLAGKRLPVREALSYALDIASALDHAHRHGIVHRDLKPANIMLTASGATLLDFGLAKLRLTTSAAIQDWGGSRSAAMSSTSEYVNAAPAGTDDAQVTSHGAILGTIRYMAPEQIVGHVVDARSDLFSFGAVVFEMLTGRPAFDGSSVARIRAAVLEQEPPTVSSVQPSASPALDHIVRRCLSKDLDARWQTSSDVLRELQHVFGSSVQCRTRAGSQPRRIWRTAGRVLVAAVSGLALWVMAGGLEPDSESTSGRV